MIDIDELIAEARWCAPGDDATELAVIVHRLADALEAATRVPVQGEPNDDREAVTKFPAIILDSAFIRWRNVEIDRTGTLPEGFEMFRAGWNRAVAAVNGEHDHIEDGANYLDCAACAFSAGGQPSLEALLEVLMGLPVSVRRDTTELGRAILAAFPVSSRAAVPDAATDGRLSLAELEDIAETHAFCADRLFIETKLVDGIRAERDAARAAAERVRMLHRNAGPSQGYDSRLKGGYGMLGDCCATCGSHGEYGVEWPCPTAVALGLNEGDER